MAIFNDHNKVLQMGICFSFLTFIVKKQTEIGNHKVADLYRRWAKPKPTGFGGSPPAPEVLEIVCAEGVELCGADVVLVGVVAELVAEERLEVHGEPGGDGEEPVGIFAAFDLLLGGGRGRGPDPLARERVVAITQADDEPESVVARVQAPDGDDFDGVGWWER